MPTPWLTRTSGNPAGRSVSRGWGDINTNRGRGTRVVNGNNAANIELFLPRTHRDGNAAISSGVWRRGLGDASSAVHPSLSSSLTAYRVVAQTVRRVVKGYWRLHLNTHSFGIALSLRRYQSKLSEREAGCANHPLRESDMLLTTDTAHDIA